jgi:hypothetical protein
LKTVEEIIDSAEVDMKTKRRVFYAGIHFIQEFRKFNSYAPASTRNVLLKIGNEYIF